MSKYVSVAEQKALDLLKEIAAKHKPIANDEREQSDERWRKYEAWRLLQRTITHS